MRYRLLVWTFLAASLAASASSHAQVDNVLAPGQARGVDYGKLPLMFEKNQGQAAGEVKFLSRGPGYTAYLTAGSIVLSLRPPVTAASSSSSASASQGTSVQLTLVGAARNPAILGEDPQPGRINYFLGNDSAQWRTNIPTYAQVRYRNVYPGIDLVYYGSNRQLEYDFEVKPGADPRQIQFRVQGASQISLDSQGNLVLEAEGEEIRLQCPMVYQQSKGQRIPIEGAYVVTDSTHVAFQIAQYDASKPLVIDPVLTYSTYLGGSGTDQAAGIAVDSTGSVYLTGYTNSPNFPLATLGTLPRNANHVFVAKLNSTGTNLIYADYIGGNNEDYGLGLVLDSANDVYVTGSTGSSNFPVVNAYQSQQPGPYSGFLTKLSADGSSLLYSTYLGGSTFDQPTSIAIDSLGQVHVAGYTESQNFPTANAYQATVLASQGGSYGIYGFLTTFSVNGSSLVYSTYFAGNTTLGQTCGSTTCYPPPYSTINAVAVDANGDTYVAGGTNTNNFPTTTSAYLTSNPTQLGATISFVSKFNSSGGLVYSTYFYGTSGDPVQMNGIAVDGSGSAYVTGAADSDGTFPVTTTSICDPGVSGFACSYAFVTKFDAGGSTLLYSTFLGANNYATPQAIALDSSDDAYVVAATSSPLFQTNNAIEAYTNQLDLLLVEIDPEASTQLFSTYFGGSGNDTPVGLALDSSGNIYVAGSTNSTDLPVTQGAFQSVLAGSSNTFVAKVGDGSTPNILFQPSTLQFSSEPVGTSSASQRVQVQNMSSLAVTITSITATGDFAQTNNCGSTLPATSSCTVSVTFTPTAVGTRTGNVVLSDSALQSPQAVSLSGTGLGAMVALAPSSLTFPNTQVGGTGAAQTVTLTNQGNASLTIASIQSVGDFTQTNNCPGTLAAGSTCTISVTFMPTAEGSRTGSVQINDNASGSPQQISLSGTGLVTAAALSPASLTFPNTQVGVSSATQTATLTNQGNASLNIANIQISGDYAQTNNCQGTLAAASSCTVTITFTPTATGSCTGTLTITDNAAGSPQTVALSGTGSDFSLTTSQNTATVNPGSMATYTVTVAPVGGAFTSAVKLSCGNAPALTNCSISPSSATPGSNPTTVTVTITTTGSSAEASPLIPLAQRPVYAVLVQFQGLGIFGMLAIGSRGRKKKWILAILLALLVTSVLLMPACAGGTGIGQQKQETAPGTYAVTVTGTSGSLQHALPLTLVVQ